MKKSVFYLLFLLLLGACIPNVNRNVQVEWQPEFLGPVAFTQLTPDAVAASIEPKAQYLMDAADLGIPGYQTGSPVNVPALGPLNLPASYESLSSMINTLEADEAVFTLSFQNNMPVNIKQGTRIVAFDSATQNIIFDHIIDRDIVPGDSYSNSETAYQKVLSSSWGMQIRDFRSDGGSNVQFSGSPLIVRYKLKIIRFLKATLNPGKEFSFDFTTDITLPSADSLNVRDIHGFLSLFIDNNLPAEVELSLQLLNQQNDTLYRFFNGLPALIPSAQLDAQGNTVAPVPTDFPEIVSLDTLQTFTDVTRLTGKIRFRSPNINAYPIVDTDNYFKIKLAARLGFTMDITQ